MPKFLEIAPINAQIILYSILNRVPNTRDTVFPGVEPPSASGPRGIIWVRAPVTIVKYNCNNYILDVKVIVIKLIVIGIIYYINKT